MGEVVSHEFGRLMKGLKGGIQGTETMRFIQKHEVSYDKKVTHARFVCDYRPKKEQKERTRIAVEGDKLDYQGELSTKTAGLTNHKDPPQQCGIISRVKIHDSRCE